MQLVCNVDQVVVDHIISSSGFVEGSIPVKYLGLPLISSQLTSRHCLPLVMRIRSRIDAWFNCALSQAGRLQLLKIILFGIQNFWASHFVLPKSVIKRLQSLFVRFLWGGSSSNTKLVKVSWSDCCIPKVEGGLGLRDLSTWNTASCLFQLWRITQPSSSSLWLMWFQRTFLKNKAF